MTFSRALAAAALLLSAASIHAIPPDEAPEIEVFVAGSTAQDAALENLMRLTSGIAGTPNVCQTGTLDIYRGEIGGTKKRVYYCLTSEHIEGVPSGLRLAVHKSSGGSEEGVAPVASARRIAFIDLENLPDSKTCRQPSRVLHTGNLAAYNEYHLFDTEQHRFIAKIFYNMMLKPEAKADRCVECGQCLEHCPQNIPIPDELAKVTEDLSDG